MRVLALVPYPLGRAPCQRYRIEQWAPYLAETGICIEFQPFADSALLDALYARGAHATKTVRLAVALARGLLRAGRGKAFDAVYLHREASLIGPALIERATRRVNHRLLYDFDDAVWMPYVSPTNRYFSYLKAPRKTMTICRLAKTVTVGNEFLAQFARQHNASVHVMPSTVSLREYKPRPLTETSLPIIGWTGSHSSAQYLRLVEEPLRKLARSHRFRFRVIGLERYELDGVDVESLPWTAATEVQDLWGIDVGIMPLLEDPWTVGKCAMKALQYMGIGVPAVVSPVGASASVVQHGVNGFHARTGVEWLGSLDRLLRNPAERRAFGAAGRLVVERAFSAEVQAPRLATVLRGLQ